MTDMQKYILDRTIPEPNTGCWLWNMSLDQDGYGRAVFKAFKTPAHRISYLAFKGDLGKMMVCHKCDTPACVNPDHLWLGTAKDNAVDCSIKGRKQKSHCINGHEFTAENTYIKRHKSKSSKCCRTCVLERLNSEKYKIKSQVRYKKKMANQTQEDRDILAAKKREYNANKKEHIAKVRRAYRLKNLEKIRAYERSRNR
jgi:hypothetical protein